MIRGSESLAMPTPATTSLFVPRKSRAFVCRCARRPELRGGGEPGHPPPHVLSSRFKPYHVALFLGKYAWLTARRRPVVVHFEVTLRCNARCGFCDYWKTDASARDDELAGYADAARYFNPMLVTFTGGEPTLRRDLEAIVAEVH